MPKELLFFNPVFKQEIWGGKRLGSDWGYDIPGDNTGECWGIAAHEHGDCTVREGKYKGQTLSSLWKNSHELFGEASGEAFPLLVKIIDAAADLSIQVHPDEAYASENENGSGKTECWYILDCPEGAELVIGHNANTKAELKEMVDNRQWDKLIRSIPIRRGDFIQIDPGTIHAITQGVMILETQQNSDITYRVYDYDRLQNGKPRTLHVKKSLDVITVPAKRVDDQVINVDKFPKNKLEELISNKHYDVFWLEIDGEFEMEQKYPFLLMSVIEGEGMLNNTSIKRGDHFMVSAGFGEIKLEGQMKLIASTIGE